MAEPQMLVERYIAAFNETDPARRRRRVETLYRHDSTYTDPQVHARGPAEIEAFIAATQQAFPGFVFTLAGAVDAHHEQARFQWAAGSAGASDQPFAGFDVIVTQDDRIRSVYGFMDAAPAAPGAPPAPAASRRPPGIAPDAPARRPRPSRARPAPPGVTALWLQ